MIINHNIPAVLTNNALNRANSSVNKSSRRLSTGYRINDASDDAAGLAISNKMQAQINGLGMAQRNAEDANSLIATADGGLGEIENMLQRMRELAVEGSNGIYSTEDREKIQTEIDQLVQEINDTSKKTQFNTKNLLDGSNANFVFQIGQNTGLNLDLKIDSVSALNLGYTNKSGSGNNYYTYTGTYQTLDENSQVNGTIEEKNINIRSIASLCSNYSDFYSNGVMSNYEILDTQITTLNASMAKYEKLISQGVDANSTEAINALNDVKKMYSYIEDTAQTLDTLINESDFGTHDTSDSPIDISSQVNAANNSLSAFNDALKQRVQTLEQTGVDSGKNQSLSSLSDLKDTLDNTLIPAAESYFNSVDDGKGVYASQEGCQAAIVICDNAIATISTMRAVLGAAQNRIDYTISSLQTSDENLQNSLSRVKDADMAEEMMKYSQYNVIVQSGISMLSQANQRPNQLLSLIQ